MSMYQVMPKLSADEYSELKTDIKERGVMVPIELAQSQNKTDFIPKLEV